MPVWLGLGALLTWNYRRSLADKSTLCSHGRKYLRPRVFILGWVCLSTWLVPHFINPTLEHPLTVPTFLSRMPAKILFGTARGIEQWCSVEGLQRPTLLDLSNARTVRAGDRPSRRPAPRR